MSINSSGIICDICGEYILLDKYYKFTLKGYVKIFHCHVIGDCKAILFKAKSWKDLPVKSPIRRTMEEIEAKVQGVV